MQTLKDLRRIWTKKLVVLKDVIKSCSSTASNTQAALAHFSTDVSADEMENVYKKLNQCDTKAIALSLIDPYAEQFISKSHSVPVPSDLYETSNLDLEYPDLLRKCLDVQLNISNEDIKIVEEDTRAQAKASSVFRHRVGRIGASVCGAAYHTSLGQPSESLIQSICYPHLFKVNTKAVKHGIKYEDYAIKAYEQNVISNTLTLSLKDVACL